MHRAVRADLELVGIALVTDFRAFAASAKNAAAAHGAQREQHCQEYNSYFHISICCISGFIIIGSM